MDFEKISPRDNSSEKNESKKLPTEESGVESQISKLKGLVESLVLRVGEIVNNEKGHLGDKKRVTSSKEENGKKDENGNLTRRDFLKVGGAGVVGMALGMSAEELLLGENEEISTLKQEQERKIRELELERRRKKLEEARDKIYKEMREKKLIDSAQALRNILGKQYLENGMVRMNEKASLEIKYFWEKEYRRKGRQYLGLEESLGRMKPWFQELKSIFEKELVDVDKEVVKGLIYLTIPESHFINDSNSGVGARGVYQLMPNTARGLDLVVDNNVDERFDILANAQGAAKLLHDYYSEAKSAGDSRESSWRLALARFNGSYVKKYFREYNIRRYRPYLKFREDSLNTFFREVEEKGYIWRDLRKKEKVKSVAKKYGVALEDIELVKEATKKGLTKFKVKIPIELNEEGRIDEKFLNVLFKDYLASSLENLNYPEKFYAVLEVLKKEELFLEADNDRENIDFLTVGELKKKYKGKQVSLKNISFLENYKLQSLKRGNSHIKDENVVLSDEKYDKVKIYFLSKEVLNNSM